MRLLGTARLTWRRLDVLLQQAADDPTTALWRDMAGEHADLPLRLAIASEHSLRVLVWQKTKDGRSGSNPPKPLNAAQPESRRLAVDLAAKKAAFEARVRDQEKEA